MTSTGQNTGMSKASKSVAKMEMTMACVAFSQNWVSQEAYLELGKAPDKRTELVLVTLLRGMEHATHQARRAGARRGRETRLAFLDILRSEIRLKRGVELGRKERQEQVQQVDEQCITHCVSWSTYRYTIPRQGQCAA